MHNSSRNPKTRNGWASHALLGLVGIALLVYCNIALGQAGSKESQKFLSYSEDARKSLAKARSQLQTTLSRYNTLIVGEAKKPQSVYKDLTKALDKTEKLAARTRGRVEKMQEQADKVFTKWQRELEAYQSDQMRQLGAERLEVTQQRYEQMIARMRAAAEAYDPLVAALHDQVLFMGRDLSAEALGALTEMAEVLNRMAEDLYARIAEVLEEEVQDEALLTGEGEEGPPKT